MLGTQLEHLLGLRHTTSRGTGHRRAAARRLTTVSDSGSAGAPTLTMVPASLRRARQASRSTCAITVFTTTSKLVLGLLNECRR
jgi:hypothetical protein